MSIGAAELAAHSDLRGTQACTAAARATRRSCRGTNSSRITPISRLTARSTWSIRASSWSESITSPSSSFTPAITAPTERCSSSSVVIVEGLDFSVPAAGRISVHLPAIAHRGLRRRTRSGGVDQMTEIRHIFFDIGGVLGSNGWDREQRERAVEPIQPERRRLPVATRGGRRRVGGRADHASTSTSTLPCSTWTGQFSRQEFIAVHVLPECAERRDDRGLPVLFAPIRRYTLMTLNNESEELNIHRIEKLRHLADLRGIHFIVLARRAQADPQILQSRPRNRPGRAGELAVHRRPAAEPRFRRRTLGMNVIHVQIRTTAALRAGAFPRPRTTRSMRQCAWR